MRWALVGVVGLLVGALTAEGQQWLPPQLGSLANSSGTWALVAFGLALLGTNPKVAAAFGVLTLLTLLGGYVLATELRGYPASLAMVVTWSAAAVVAGPLVGLGACWVKSGHTRQAAVGVGAMSGLLVGEGSYGLAYIAATTSPPYWWGEIVAGLVLLLVLTGQRLRGWTAITLAIGTTVLAAVAFFLLYGQGLPALLD